MAELGRYISEALRNMNYKIFNRIPLVIKEKEVKLIRICFKVPEEIDLSFLLGTIIEPTKGCWVKGDWSNYKIFKKEGAHRLSYRIFIGQIIHQVCHHCDRKGCYNPLHLYLGTQAENLVDSRLKRGNLNLIKRYRFFNIKK